MFVWDFHSEVRERVNNHFPVLGNFPILSNTHEPGLADGFGTLANPYGFSLQTSLSLSKDQGPPLHRKNTYLQRNEDSGRRMSFVEVAQRA